jgi:hypothetical protein
LLQRLAGPRRLETIPSDLFEDPGAMASASGLAADWFRRQLA